MLPPRYCHSLSHLIVIRRWHRRRRSPASSPLRLLTGYDAEYNRVREGRAHRVDSGCAGVQKVRVGCAGVRKVRVVPEDMYVLSSDETILFTASPKPYPSKAPKCTDCAPLSMKEYCHAVETCLLWLFVPGI